MSMHAQNRFFRFAFLLISVILFVSGCLRPDVWKPCSERDSDYSGGPCDSGEAESECVDGDADGVTDCDNDCDDNNADIYPDALEVCDEVDNDCDGETDEGVTSTQYWDEDGDGYGDPTSDTIETCESVEGFSYDATDCNDSDDTVHPDATELCDEVDNDCDSEIDEGVTGNYYRDIDGDGYGDPIDSTFACGAPEGYVSDNTDCDDDNINVHPYMVEVCDELDNDCDGTVDEDVTTTYYMDRDGDDYGTTEGTTEACPEIYVPTGYAENADDCDDFDNDINPGVAEVCDNVDNDCDGAIDADDSGVTDLVTYYYDADGDGYGESTPNVGCEIPSGYVTDGTDCDDAHSSVNPDASEICDSLDNDCNSVVDDSATDAPTWYLDTDSDGYGVSSSMTSCTQPSGYAEYDGDCNDANSDVHPYSIVNECRLGTKSPMDYNCDGTSGYGDNDGDGFFTCDDDIGTDCDDGDPNTYPGAVEVCDNKDNDCNGSIDDSATDTTTYYADSDSDGYGDTTSTVAACDLPSGYVTDNTDCDDVNPLANPGAIEICDSVDNDCNGSIDDGARDLRNYYHDADGDGYGDSFDILLSCSVPSGYVTNDLDCDDVDSSSYPGASEICDSADNDCDGTVDDSAIDATTYYADNDSDSYGNVTSTVTSCTMPSGYVTNSTDCNDGVTSVYPGASESCDGTDSDCDGSINDPDSIGVVTWYADTDSDSYGDATNTTTACWIPTGYSANNTDCDDTNDAANPGEAEVCDGADNDCDGATDESGASTTYYRDSDSDGYGNISSTVTSCAMPSGYVLDATDCNDSAASVHPGATELCDDADQDCDGVADDGLTATTQYRDADSDGYGNSAISISDCAMLSGYVTDSTDCNDTSSSIHPGATEVCDSVDNDCDGATDESGTTTYYLDADSDGYGNPALMTTGCSATSGYVTNNTDCNDSNSSINPGATEVCDGIDQDCSGTADDVWECEDVDSDGIPNTEDFINLIDADGDGGIDACVPGFMVLDDPYDTAAAYIQFQGLSYTSLVTSSSRSQNGDVDDDGVMDSWCVTTDDFATSEESFRLVSTLSASNPADMVGLTDCSDWEIPSFTDYCTTYSDCCTYGSSSWDGCRYIGWVPYVHDDGTNLSCP